MQQVRFSYRANIVFVLVLLTTLGYGQRSSPPPWYSLDSKAGGFSIKFPQKPKFESEAMLGGALTSNTYSHSVGDDFGFNVAYFEMPGATQDDSEQRFETMAKFAFSNMKGSIISSHAINTGGCSGREYNGKGPSNQTVRMQLFNSGQRSFMVLFIASTAAKNVHAISDYFFNSLKISDGCTGGFAPVEAPSTETTKAYLDGVIDPVTGWRRLVVAKHEFQLLAPNRTEVESGRASIKPLPITETVYSSNNGTTSYLLIIDGDYPSGLVTTKTQAPALDDIEQKFRAFLETNTRKIVFTRDMSVGGFPGREFNIVSDTKTGRAEIFVTKKRSYFFITISDKDNFNSVYANRFFGSIRISVK